MQQQAARPSYQDSLRAIGRYFDRNIYRHILVSEVDDGFIARAFPSQQAHLRAEGIALPMSDIRALIATQEQARGVPISDVKMPPLCPTGYEDFFRSLGFDLDGAEASNVSVVELNGGFLVAFNLKKGRTLDRAQMFYDAQKVDDLLTRGYQRRRR